MDAEHIQKVHSSEFIAKLSDSRHAPAILTQLPSMDLFIAKYKYGQFIAAPASEADRYSKLQAPCQANELCEGCRGLLMASGQHRSLGFVIRGAVEEQLSLEQRAGWHQYVRRIPVNIAEQGEFFT